MERLYLWTGFSPLPATCTAVALVTIALAMLVNLVGSSWLGWV
ncbi:MAG: hypothetical protein ACYTXI_37220 [Nostoc sp.]